MVVSSALQRRWWRRWIGFLRARRSRDECSSLDEDPAVPAGHERRDIGQDSSEAEAAGIGEVVRLPDRIELLLVRAETLEVVDGLAMVVKKPTNAIPERGDRRPFKP